MKTVYILLSILLLLAGKSGAVEIQKKKEILIDQSSTFLQKIYKFAVTEDEYYLFPDSKAGNIKIYNNKGKLARVWGRKGFGPDEYVFPRYCDYRQPYFVLMDWGHRKVFVFKRENTLDFKKIHENYVMGLGYDLKLIDENRVFVSGYLQSPGRESFELYRLDLETDKRIFFISSPLKYGYKSRSEYDAAYVTKIATLSITGYFDYYEDFIYYAWNGNLKLFKIDLKTKVIDYFGKKTENYITPFVTPEHLEMYSKRSKDLHVPKQKMSWITGIFTDDHFVGVIYEKNKKETDEWRSFVQFYSLKGEFIEEKNLEGARNVDHYPESYFFYSQGKDTLYFLSHLMDEEFDDIYKILEYKIIP
jgi:hypothetical protein